MGRMIDADKLKKDVLDLQNCYNGFSDTYDKACIIGVIDEQPSAEPEIIRCKDCRRYGKDNCFVKIQMLWELRPDDYCSYGERKEGKQDE